MGISFVNSTSAECLFFMAPCLELGARRVQRRHRVCQHAARRRVIDNKQSNRDWIMTYFHGQCSYRRPDAAHRRVIENKHSNRD